MTRDSTGQSSIDLSHLSRRDVLRAGVASGIPAVLAGCFSSDEDADEDADGGSDNDDVSTPDERVDTRFVIPEQGATPIEQTNWNVFAPSQYPWDGRDKGRLTHVEFQIYSPQADEEHMVLGKSWELVDDTTLRQTFKDDIQWWDGTEITTRDIEVEERMNDALVEISDDFRPSSYVEDWRIIDDKTWEYDLKEPYAEEFVKFAIIKSDLEIKADVYESWANELEDLIDDGDEEGQKEKVKELLDHHIPNEEMYGNGPFKYKDHDDTRFITEVFEDYVYADSIHFTELMWKSFENKSEAFITGNVDAIRWAPNEEQKSRAPEFHWTDKFRKVPTGIHMNMGMYFVPDSDAPEGIYDPITKEPDGWLVRKAIGYAINPEQFAMAWHDQAEPLDQPESNYPYASYENDAGPISREWIDENLENYAPHQPDKAKEMLEAAGLTWDDDEEEWLDWDGESFEVLILDKSDPSMAQVVQQNLKDIGLNVALNASESFGSDRWEGEFDLLPDTGSGTTSSVFSGFPKVGWYAGMYHGPSGYDEENPWKVPTPVGNTDVTDPAEREDFFQWEAFNDYLVSGDVERLKELLWSVNQFLPTVSFAAETATGSINAERWDVDGPDGLLHSGGKRGYYNILKHEAGTIAPNEDSDYHD